MTPEQQEIVARCRRVVELQHARDLEAARDLSSETLEIARRSLGEDDPIFALSLSNRAGVHYAMAEYPEAERLYRQALGIGQRTLGERNPIVATTLNNLAVVHHDMGDHATAETLHRQALEIRRDVLEPDDPQLAESVNNLAVLLGDRGEHAAAEPLLQEALDIYRQAFGERHPMVAQGLSSLAALQTHLGDRAAAASLYGESLKILRSGLGPDHPQVARVLHDLGALHRGSGDFTAAEPLYREALDIRRRTLGPDDPDALQTMGELALMRHHLGNYTGAFDLYREGVRLARARGDRNPSLGTLLNNLAWLHHDMGDHAAAEPLYTEALEIRRETLGPDHPDVAQTLNNLALLLHDRGSYAAAEPMYREALAAARGGLGNRHPQVATNLNNLAGLLQDLGDDDAAESFYREALDIRRDVLEGEHPDIAQTLHNLAGLYANQGKHPEAVSLLREALAIHRSRFGERHAHFANTLNSLALVHRDMGDYAGAEPLYRQALAIARTSFGDRDARVAITLSNLAWVRHELSDYQGAEPLYREALDIHRATLGDRHPQLAQDLYHLAALQVATDRQRDALDLMWEAAQIEDRLLGEVLTVGSERQRLAFLGTLARTEDGLLSLVHGRFSADPDAVGRTLDLVLRRKGVGVEVLAAQREAVLAGRAPELAGKFQELAALRMQIAQRTLAGPGSEGPEEHRRLLRDWLEEKEALEATLARSVPEMALQERLRQADRRAVAGLLPEGSALVEFVRFEAYDFDAIPARGERRWKAPRYAAFVLAAGRPDEVRMVDLGEAGLIDELIARYRDAVAGEGRERAARGQEREPIAPATPEREAGIDLRTAIFDPVAANLEGRTRLFLAPAGDLTRLPFEVLPAEDGRRLIDAYTLSYLGTGRDVVRFGSAPREGEESLVAAAPDFDLSGPPSAEPPRARVSRDIDLSEVRFGPLGGTVTEGEGVARMIGVSPLLGDAVLETRLKTSRSPRIVHLATHGFFLPNQERDLERERLGPMVDGSDGAGRPRGTMENPLLRSGLALAGVNTFLAGGTPPPEAEDGILTAEDVSGLDLLGTELAVLSACETGLGEVRRGEGVFGLRRAFVVAGARTLVMSLWRVPDDPSADLMRVFYRNLLKGMGRAEALREAQLALAGVYPPPSYWGAFICQGDPGPLSLDRGPAVTEAVAEDGAPAKVPVEVPAPEEAASPSAPSGLRSPSVEEILPTAPTPEPSAPAVETGAVKPAPPRTSPEPQRTPSLAEIVAAAGFLFVEAGGRLAISSEGPRAGGGMVEGREFGDGMALFSVPLPELPARLGRKKALRNLLRLSHSANYVKAVLLPSGEVLLSAEMPMSALSPEVAAGIVRGLAQLADVKSGDLGDDRLWSERLTACLREQAAAIRLDLEEAATTIPTILANSSSATMTLPDGSVMAALGMIGSGPQVRVTWNDVVIVLISLLDVTPRGDEKRYLSRLLELNGIADGAKVGLDTQGRVALLYELPRLTAELMPQIKAELARLTLAVAAIDSEA